MIDIVGIFCMMMLALMIFMFLAFNNIVLRIFILGMLTIFIISIHAERKEFSCKIDKEQNISSIHRHGKTITLIQSNGEEINVPIRYTKVIHFKKENKLFWKKCKTDNHDYHYELWLKD